MTQQYILAILGFFFQTLIADGVLAVALAGGITERATGNVAALHKFECLVAVHCVWHFSPKAHAYRVNLVAKSAHALVTPRQYKLAVVEHGQLYILPVKHFTGDAARLQLLVIVIPPIAQEARADTEFKRISLYNAAFLAAGGFAYVQIRHNCNRSFLQHKSNLNKLVKHY